MEDIPSGNSTSKNLATKRGSEEDNKLESISQKLDDIQHSLDDLIDIISQEDPTEIQDTDELTFNFDEDDIDFLNDINEEDTTDHIITTDET